MSMKKKFIIATTIPATFVFFRGNLRYLSRWFDVCAVSSDPVNLTAVGERENVRTYCVPMTRSISILRDFCCLIVFIRFLLHERPYIVHGNTPKASMLSMLASKLVGVPKRIYMCHGLRYQGSKGIMRWMLMGFEKLSCKCATKVICVSYGVQRTLVSDGICPARKTVVVGFGSANGINIEWYNPHNVVTTVRRDLKINKDDFVFIYVGRVVRDKGINELISAFQRIDNKKVHLVLVGKEENDLNPISNETRLAIENNIYIHAVGRKTDVRPYILASNALVLPSYREGFGMVLLEANALGVPCISTDIIGCNEIINPGVNGDLIPPKDENALFNKMKEWVDNPERVQFMASHTRNIVAERYDQKKVREALLKEYMS
jgi:glycosyltransferase involved in cell wall biosynthesis